MFGFVEASKIGGEVDLPSEEDAVLDETVAADKKGILALKRNAIAVANPTSAFTTDGTMALV